MTPNKTLIQKVVMYYYHTKLDPLTCSVKSHSLVAFTMSLIANHMLETMCFDSQQYSGANNIVCIPRSLSCQCNTMAEFLPFSEQASKQGYYLAGAGAGFCALDTAALGPSKIWNNLCQHGVYQVIITDEVHTHVRFFDVLNPVLLEVYSNRI